MRGEGGCLGGCLGGPTPNLTVLGVPGVRPVPPPAEAMMIFLLK